MGYDNIHESEVKSKSMKKRNKAINTGLKIKPALNLYETVKDFTDDFYADDKIACNRIAHYEDFVIFSSTVEG